MVLVREGEDGLLEFLMQRERGLEEPIWEWTVLAGNAYQFASADAAVAASSDGRVWEFYQIDVT